MKKTMSVAFIGLLMVVAVVMLESAAVAQQPSGYNINVPFSFNIGDRVFSEGEYRVSRIARGVFAIKGVDSTNYGTVITSPIDRRGQDITPKLVFRHYGSRYFLSQIWLFQVSTGGQLEKSRAEVEYAKLIGEKTETLLLGK